MMTDGRLAVRGCRAARRRGHYRATTAVARAGGQWSEQRHHLAGALGAALGQRMFDLGWVRRARRSRAVHISDEGHEGLRATFGLEVNGR
jgi:hypothetical protein